MKHALGDIVALETQLWEALRTGDASRDASLLSEDFLGVYPTGFSSKSEHCGQLVAGATVQNYRLSETRIMSLSDDLVLLSYLATWQRADSGTRIEEKMYISSIWKRTHGKWLNVFSQDTPC